MDGSDPRLPGGSVNPSARNYNSVSLVSSISPAKWLVPRGDAAETGWQDLAYDDSGWSDGWGVLGFETGVTDDPLEMTRSLFRVREVRSSQQLQTLDDADRLLTGENVVSSVSFTRIPVINYVQGGSGGFFKEGDQPFPNGGVDNFALDIRGTMQVNKAGTYTFGVSVNDAARLKIDGNVLFADTQRHTADDVRLVTLDLTADRTT